MSLLKPVNLLKGARGSLFIRCAFPRWFSFVSNVDQNLHDVVTNDMNITQPR